MTEKAIPTALGSMIRSRLSGMTLVRLRSGWVNFNQSVSHHDSGIVAHPSEWDVLFDNTPEPREPEPETVVPMEKLFAIRMNALHRESLLDYLTESTRRDANVREGSSYDARLRNIVGLLENAERVV